MTVGALAPAALLRRSGGAPGNNIVVLAIGGKPGPCILIGARVPGLVQISARDEYQRSYTCTLDKEQSTNSGALKRQMRAY